MFDICAICANQNDQGKCIKPGQTCDEAYDFRLKPVYQAAPEMYEALKASLSYITEGIPSANDVVILLEKAISKAEGK